MQRRDVTARSDALAILAMAIGTFAVGTGEFVIMGLLPTLARDLGASEAQTGGLISAYALGVVVGAPLIAVFSARFPRRAVLLCLLVVVVLGNIGSALAPGFWSLYALRFISGLPHGAFFGLAALVAASMVDVTRRARAVGRVMLGLTLSTLLGLPLSAWLGQIMGWRPAFAFVGFVGLVSFVMIRAFVPAIDGDAAASPLRELGALKRPQVWLTLGIASIGCGGMFAVFSYIVPLLTEVTRIPLPFIPLTLALFGIGMALGNIVGARFADMALMPTIGGMLVFNLVVLAALPLTAPVVSTALASLLCIGFFIAIATALQTRLMDVAADGQTLAAALNHAAFNVSNALGAYLGGLAIAAGYGLVSTGYVGALLALGGLVLFLISWLLDRHQAMPLAAAR